MNQSAACVAVCVSHGFKCSLQVSQDDTVLHLCVRLGKQMQYPPSCLVLISKGKILTSRMDATLASFGLFMPVPSHATSGSCCKILVSKMPPGPEWIEFTTRFLCTTSLKPVTCRMHAESPIANVKRQLRELLRCPNASFFLYAADGNPLSDTTIIRDLKVSNGSRLYCRVLAEEPAPNAPTAATVQPLIREADAAWHTGVIGGAGAQEQRRERKRGRDDGPERGPCFRKAARSPFAGMRRGFLSDPCRPPEVAAARTAAPAGAGEDPAPGPARP